MKRYYITALMSLLLVLGACNTAQPIISESDAATIETIITEIDEIPPHVFVSPDKIALGDPEIIIEFDGDPGFTPKYRMVYYSCGLFTELVDPAKLDAFDELHNSRRFVDGRYVDFDEMMYVMFIKYFNIPKEEFVIAVENQRLIHIKWGDDMTTPMESNELPNADIIYTFDNEIINAYYRRENPVVPDWTKVKTYESYSAYLEDNPQ